MFKQSKRIDDIIESGDDLKISSESVIRPLSTMPELDFNTLPELQALSDSNSISAPSSPPTEDLASVAITPRQKVESTQTSTESSETHVQVKSQNRTGKGAGFILGASAVSIGTYYSANFLMQTLNETSTWADDNAHIPQIATKVFLGTVAVSLIVGAVNLSMATVSKVQEKVSRINCSLPFKNIFEKPKTDDNENLLSASNS